MGKPGRPKRRVSRAKPSPGPWGFMGPFIVDQEGDLIALICSDANAPLVAAAPEVITALKRVRHLLVHTEGVPQFELDALDALLKRVDP